MLAQISHEVLGVRVSAQEVSSSMRSLLPAARRFLDRPLGGRRWIYLYVDGTNFRVRRATVEREPTLVVLGVDETGRKSVLSMIQGDKDNRRAWEAVFADLKTRGLEASAVQLGIMDGLPGIELAFIFGSQAAGVAGAASDVDLLVVGSAGLRALAPRLRPVASALGREVNPHVLSRETFSEKARTGDAFIASVLAAPKLWIVGGADELGTLV